MKEGLRLARAYACLAIWIVLVFSGWMVVWAVYDSIHHISFALSLNALMVDLLIATVLYVGLPAVLAIAILLLVGLGLSAFTLPTDFRKFLLWTSLTALIAGIVLGILDPTPPAGSGLLP